LNTQRGKFLEKQGELELENRMIEEEIRRNTKGKGGNNCPKRLVAPGSAKIARSIICKG
jgi:hypothetical protein